MLGCITSILWLKKRDRYKDVPLHSKYNYCIRTDDKAFEIFADLGVYVILHRDALY